jgi:hypothetical protein
VTVVLYVRDQTGRFHQRPHYRPEELDSECELIITEFLKDVRGEVRYPVETEDLKMLIDRDTEDLDVYADLASYGSDVEGVTEFTPGSKPSVKISARLTEDNRYENRLRTTLTHEYGHVRFHGSLFEGESSQAELPLGRRPDRNNICKRDSMIDAAQTDWMEWQAGYVCGALLMPKTVVLIECRRYVEELGLHGTMSLQTPHGAALIDRVGEMFRVSNDAARVRLLKLRQVTPGPGSGSLFG